MNGTKMRLNLKMIATVDFRRGVPFHYDEMRRKKLLREVAEDETILLVSQTGLQLAFVFQEVSISSRNGEPVKAIGHYRLQLSRHTPWSPDMLSEYAEHAGIDLLGVKKFEEFIKGAA